METFVWSVWAVAWICLVAHYTTVHYGYAAQNVHVTNPLLYVAVESWLLLSLLVAMYCLGRAVRAAERE